MSILFYTVLAQADEQHEAEGLRSTGERAGRVRTTGVVVIIIVTGPDARSVICERLVDHESIMMLIALTLT